MIEVRSPLAASVVGVVVELGQAVRAGTTLVIVESMKMEHEVRAAQDGEVVSLRVCAGDVVTEGEVLVVLGANLASRDTPSPAKAGDETSIESVLREDLLELHAREAFTADANRPDAVARRHALGLRTARENLFDLCDEGSFVEYGALAFAAQQGRRSLDDLVRHTPADGMVTGIGSINAASFGAERSRAVVLAYDATVLAGTQGMRNHQKTDRMLGIALEQKLPSRQPCAISCPPTDFAYTRSAALCRPSSTPVR